jgi:hypothetical protein
MSVEVFTSSPTFIGGNGVIEFVLFGGGGPISFDDAYWHVTILTADSNGGVELTQQRTFSDGGRRSLFYTVRNTTSLPINFKRYAVRITNS